MRILHINSNYLRSGLHQLLIEELDALGFENQVFVPCYDMSQSVVTPNDNVCFSECFRKNDRYFFDYKQAKIIKAIEHSYDVGSFDLIHAYTLFTDGNVARVLSKKYGIPFVVAVRNTDVNIFFARRFMLRKRGRKNLLMADRIFFLSESYKRQLYEKYLSEDIVRLIENKINIIPNGIDTYWFNNKPNERKQIDASHLSLIYAGVVDKNKNISATQRAMAILREQGIVAHLTVVGKIVQQEEYEKVISDEYTTYIPAQPKEELIKLYRENDIFVMPSITESFGLVYAEAMSQGLPVIYSKGQGFDNQFHEGEVGFHVYANDPENIADAIKKIINDYNAISMNSLSLVDKFRWDIIGSKYEKEYKDTKRETAMTVK